MKLWFVLLPLAASAQLQLYLIPQPGVEQPVTGFHDLGRVFVGDTSPTRFRIRNNGSATTNLTAIHVSGSGFSMTGQPTVPHILAPGTNVDFTIHFRPPDHGSFSANLQINATGYLLRATGIAAAALFYDNQPLAAGAVLDFGRIERGSEHILNLEARNITREPVAINSLELTGPFTSPVAAPINLAPGESKLIPIRFAPTMNQIHTGSLTLDGTRVIRLTGVGLEPPPPRPIPALDTPVLRSAEQGKLTIRLASVSRANVKGQVRLELQPAGEAKDNDAAAQFLSGSRTASFTIREGAMEVVFDSTSSSSIVFQTGTTAGQLVFTVESGGYTERIATTISGEPVRWDRTTAARNVSSVELNLSGFDNTRTAGEFTFTFFTSDGQSLAPIKLNAASDFARWWITSTFGGTFALRATFPITGDASKLRGVEVQLINATGASRTDRLAF